MESSVGGSWFASAITRGAIPRLVAALLVPLVPIVLLAVAFHVSFGGPSVQAIASTALLVDILLLPLSYGVVALRARSLADPGSEKSKRRDGHATLLALLALCAGLILTFAVSAATSYLFFMESTFDGPKAFTTQSWLDNPQARWYMADELLASGRLDGMTRAQVTALLGASADTEYFREHDLVYYLGPERSGVPIDSEWLVIDLDGAGAVVDYSIRTD